MSQRNNLVSELDIRQARAVMGAALVVVAAEEEARVAPDKLRASLRVGKAIDGLGRALEGSASRLIHYTTSDRGFKQYRPIMTCYGHEIEVHESSAAMEPSLWISIELKPENARGMASHPVMPAHLNFDQANGVVATLQAAMRHHYQLRGGDNAHN